MANHTLVTEKKEMFKVGDVPAITIAAAVENNGENAPGGWRGASTGSGVSDKIGQFCNESSGFNDTVECIDEKTFFLQEVVENATSNGATLTGPEFWRSDFFLFHYGKVFTLHSPYHLGTDWENSLFLNLKQHMSYYVWIHDKGFFLTSTNQDVIPHYLLKMDHQECVFLTLRPVNYHMMDKDDRQCHPSESYSFTKCVKNSVSKLIGCRLPWDQWTSTDIEICSTKDQIRRFEEEFYNINEIWEQSKIVSHTGCLIPCHYTAYELASQPFRSQSNISRIRGAFQTKNVTNCGKSP